MKRSRGERAPARSVASLRWLGVGLVLAGLGCGSLDGQEGGDPDAALEARRDAGGAPSPVAVDTERLGAGSPVWVIPDGPGLSHDYFHPTLEALSEFHEVVFHDPRGTGSSPGATAFGLELDVLDLEAARARLDIGRLQLIGHGYGALVALRYAEHHGQHVSTMVLVCPVTSRETFDRTSSEVARRLGPGVGATRRCLSRARSRADAAACLPVVVRALVADPSSGVADELLVATSWDPETFRSALGASFPEVGAPRRLMIPTLIIAGGEDAVPLADVRALADRLHGSRLLVLESSGHFPFAEDEADFIEGVRAFLDEFDERRFLERVGEDR